MGVGSGEELLVGAVRDGDYPWELIVVEVEEMAGEFEKRLKILLCCINQAV
jgi:hypothetical protein